MAYRAFHQTGSIAACLPYSIDETERTSIEDYHEPTRDGDAQPRFPVSDGAVARLRAGKLSNAPDPPDGSILGRRRGRCGRPAVVGSDQAAPRDCRGREPGRWRRHDRDL